MRSGWSLLLLLSALAIGCGEAPVQVLSPEEPAPLRLRSTLLGGSEGEPGREYEFELLAERLPAWSRVEWDFGDGGRVTTIGRTLVRYRFTAAGTYTVVVRLYDHSRGLLWGVATAIANIRPTPPPPAMVELPPGRFWMGSERDFTEQPIHQVELTRPLLVMVTEVPQWLWSAVMGYNPSWFRGDSLPVENVTWWEAVEFCNRLSLRHGLQPCYRWQGDTLLWDRLANGYRLPTEAEWEYACRAGTVTDTYAGDLQQPWGGCESEEPLLDDIAWYCRNSDARTHPVARKRPNAFGLYDMLGNVSEWVWDWYESTAYQQHSTTDPEGPPSGERRCVRGGSWQHGAFLVRSAARGALSPWHHSPAVGFRIVRRP